MKLKRVLVLLMTVILAAMLLPAVAGAKGVSVSKAAVFGSQLTPVNESLTTGQFHMVLQKDGKKLIVQLIMRKLVPGKAVHSAAITGFVGGGAAQFPGPSADTNGDGFISNAEYVAVAGPDILKLEPFPKMTRRGGAVFHGVIPWSKIKDLGDLKSLFSRSAVVVRGCTLMPLYGEPVYTPTAPAACGLISVK